MTDYAEPLVCQWCGHRLPAADADWWDERPQCRDVHACTRRIP